MTNQDADSGLELVLDNRKLIIAFAVVIAICGCFFVVGFIQGKRQGIQEGTQAATESLPKVNPEAAQVKTDAPAQPDEGTRPPQQAAADQSLDWYKSVNRSGGEPETIQPEPAPEPAPKVPPAAKAAISSERPKLQTSTAPVTYSVQVGAFKQKHELDVRAEALRKKGFDCRTETPQGPGGFYYLKVGKFRSRAEAVAVQLRLKKNGFSSFIKTN